MKRGWIILLALSLGLNAGMGYVLLSNRADGGEGRGQDARLPGRRGVQGPMSHPGGPPEFINERLRRAGDRLGLTEEQIKAMSDIMEEVMPELVKRREDIRDLRMQMREEYLRPEVDEARIHELRRETEAAQSELDSIMVKTMLREAKLLTPEQREAYFELMPFGGDRGKHGPRMRRGRR
jgi:Spy/CpxP family protein refolding chaperone